MRISEKVLVTNGKKSVKIMDDGRFVEFYACMNGWQSTGFPVDIELLKMMKKAIDSYLEISDVIDDK